MAGMETHDADVMRRLRVVLTEAERRGCDVSEAFELMAAVCGDLARTRGKLEESNALLEQTAASYRAFAYSVSHDLRAPLRAIDGFARIVSGRLQGGAADDHRRLLDIIGTSAVQMNAQLDGLLRLSRLHQRTLSPVSVAMEALARQVVDATRLREPQRHVEVTIGPLLPAVGDVEMLREAFVELIGNAWKFTSRNDVAHVAITSSVDGPMHVYGVCDDGVGFPAKAAARLFTVFGRLHKPDAFPGLGVGLAVVQAIVAHHRGRVWAESEQDAGARFYFSVPTTAAPVADGE